MEDSPPRLVTFREPTERTDEDERYDIALELVARVHAVLEHAKLRFHLKDQLDRAAAGIPLLLARVGDELRTTRWRTYRQALRLVGDCATLLDIIAHQGGPTPDLQKARASANRLRDELTPLARG